MKKIFSGLLFASFILLACKPSENVSEYTGNQYTYALQQVSQYTVSGFVTFKEKRDGSTLVSIELTGTTGEVTYPVHLHLGDLATPGASIAALLTPLAGKTGKSQTILTHFADETLVKYSELLKLSACIKIHLSDTGPAKDIVLAAGNVGAAALTSIKGERIGVTVCQSN